MMSCALAFEVRSTPTRSFTWTTPTVWSRSSRYTGKRDRRCWRAIAMSPARSSSSGTATISVRGTMTCRTSVSAKLSAFPTMTRSLSWSTPSRGDEHAQLLVAVDVEVRARLDADPAQECVRAVVDEPDEREHEAVKQVQRVRAQQGELDRPLEREVLRRQFANDDVDIGDHAERKREGDDVKHRLRKPPEDRRDERRDRRFADPTDRQRREGHAELRRGDVGVETPRNVSAELGTSTAALGKLLKLRPANANERILGRDEEAVREDEKEGDDGAPKCLGRVHAR